MFAQRCPLYTIENLLLTATSFLLAARFLFGSCLSLVGPFLIASPAPLTAGWHNAYCMPLAITFWHVTGSPFAFFFFDSWLTNNRALLVVSSQRFAACYSHLLTRWSLLLTVGCSPLCLQQLPLDDHCPWLAPNTLLLATCSSLFYFCYILSFNHKAFLAVLVLSRVTRYANERAASHN